jgi:hypothetical protein
MRKTLWTLNIGTELPKLTIPSGTVATRSFSRVTVDFRVQEDAERFIQWLQSLDDPQNDGATMTLHWTGR